MSRDGEGREMLEDELRFGGGPSIARPHINPKFSPKRGSTAPRVHVNPNFAHKGTSCNNSSGSSQVGHRSRLFPNYSFPPVLYGTTPAQNSSSNICSSPPQSKVSSPPGCNHTITASLYHQHHRRHRDISIVVHHHNHRTRCCWGC